MMLIISEFTLADYVAVGILVLSVATFLLDINKKSGYEYKNVFEELNISRKSSLDNTRRQRIAFYVAALALVFLLQDGFSLRGMLIALLLIVLCELISRKTIRKEHAEGRRPTTENW